MNELTHLDLFSGIGGFAIAAHRTGFRTVGFSEIEPYACEVIARRYPGVPNVGDVRKRASFARFRGVTVLTGGFPCQPWSGAGLQLGTADDRHLWPAMCDVIEAVRPTWIVGENVPDLIGLGGFDAAADDLEKLGYSTQPFVIPACAVGAWHLRNRVWILAHAEGQRCGEGFAEPDAAREAVANGDCGARSVPADATGKRRREAGQLRRDEPAQRSADRDQATDDVANAVRAGREKLDAAAFPEGQAQGLLWHHPVSPSQQRFPCWDADFAEVLRMADGLSLGLDSSERNGRIKALGNAIVPQIAEKFFRWIARIERGEIVT